MKNEIKIIKYESSHIEEIMTKHPRDRELYWCKCSEWEKWPEAWSKNGPAYTMIIDGEIIMCGGVMIFRKGFGEAWVVLSSLFYKHKKECFRAVRDFLSKIIETEKLIRVQAVVMCNFKEAEHWLIHLGFENETPTPRGLRKFGPNGEDMIMFSLECK